MVLLLLSVSIVFFVEIAIVMALVLAIGKVRRSSMRTYLKLTWIVLLAIGITLLVVMIPFLTLGLFAHFSEAA